MLNPSFLPLPFLLQLRPPPLILDPLLLHKGVNVYGKEGGQFPPVFSFRFFGSAQARSTFSCSLRRAIARFLSWKRSSLEVITNSPLPLMLFFSRVRKRSFTFLFDNALETSQTLEATSPNKR